MTEKRYVKENFFDEYAIKKEYAIIAIVDSGSNAKKICNELNALYDENEQLKQELRDYHNAFDCGQCKYHNYDWYDDGDEFEICDKGNNEAQMYYHSCKDWEEL